MGTILIISSHSILASGTECFSTGLFDIPLRYTILDAYIVLYTLSFIIVIHKQVIYSLSWHITGNKKKGPKLTQFTPYPPPTCRTYCLQLHFSGDKHLAEQSSNLTLPDFSDHET